MAFGRELQDFVSGFQTGYNLIKSPEEKEWEREKRAMAKEEFERTGRWGEEDRDYRDRRAAVGDEQWREAFDFKKFQAGQEFEQDNLDRAERLAREKLERAKEGGFRDTDQMEKFLERERGVGGEEGVIPDDSAADEMMEPTAYNDPYVVVEPASYSAADNTGFNLETYMASTRSSESGGNPRARNPNSSAVGLYQPLKGTWSDVARKYPELGLTPDGRTDPSQQERFMMAFTYDNAEALSRAGIPVTNGNLYAAHFLGSGGAQKVLRANPRSAVADLVPPEVIRANPFLSGMSVGDFERWADRKGNAATRRRKSKGKALSAAVGGMVTAIPDEEEDTDPDFVQPEETEVAQAIPEEGPVPTPRPKYEGTSEGNEDPPTDDPWEMGRRAVRDGMKKALQETGADGDSALADPELEKMRQNYIRGYGAAPQQMMRQVIDKIDPERTMPPAERNMKAMGTVYQFYMEQGDVEKAQQAAMSMVQFYRRASQQFLALGQAAAAEGDLDAAAKAAVAAYTNIPNGRDMDIQKTEDGYAITVTDAKTGKTINKKVLSPQEFGAAAMGFNPTTFDDEILNAAGVAPEQFKDASLEDVRVTDEEIGARAEEMFAEQGYNPNQINAIKDAASSIAKTQANQMGPDEALRFASDLMAFNADDPTDDSAGFSSKPVRGNPDRVQVTMNGKTVVMTKGQFNALTGARAALETERKTTREEEAKSEAASQERMDWLWKGVDAFKGAVQGEVDKLSSSVEPSAREMRIRAARRGQQGPAMPEDMAAERSQSTALKEAEQALADGYTPGYVAAMLQEAGVPEEQWPDAVRQAVNSPAGAIPEPTN
jgi:hypothetical protein